MNLQKITVLAAAFSLGCIASTHGADIAPGDEVTLSYQTSGPANVVRTSFVFGASSDSTNRSSTSRGRAGMIHWLGGSKYYYDIAGSNQIDKNLATFVNYPSISIILKTTVLIY